MGTVCPKTSLVNQPFHSVEARASRVLLALPAMEPPAAAQPPGFIKHMERVRPRFTVRDEAATLRAWCDVVFGLPGPADLPLRRRMTWMKLPWKSGMRWSGRGQVRCRLCVLPARLLLSSLSPHGCAVWLWLTAVAKGIRDKEKAGQRLRVRTLL